MGHRQLTQFMPLPCPAVLIGAILLLGSSIQAPATKAADGWFGQTSVWSVHLTIPPAEFDALQPPFPAAFGPGGAPRSAAPPAATAGAERESERNAFGTEFRWAHADFTADETTLQNVGVRYAGDMTYLVSAAGLKRPLKIAFAKFKGQDFRGLSNLQLHAMPLDPSQAREALAYSVFRACGVPSPQTAFAEVRLSVPGRFDNLLLGLYTVVEDVDEAFLKEHFETAEGLAMTPFGPRGIDFLGEAWGPYIGPYRPHRTATNDEQARVIAFARVINSASDSEFARDIGSYLDVEAFLRYLAANALTANLQSFFAIGHNYTLYLDPRSHKFHFIPGDLEFSLANLLLFGSPDELMNLSLTRPYPGDNKLPDRLLAIEEHRQRYQTLLQELSASAFSKVELLRAASAIEQATAAARERERQAIAARPASPAGPFGAPAAGGLPPPPELAKFIEHRARSIQAQLAGTSSGYVPRPFQFGPAPGQGGGLGRSGNLQPITEAAFRETVQAPAGFEATLFAAPPQVSYPVAIACEPSGAVYVAVDEQGSLGRTPGGGRILRCVDKNDDGKVDEVTVFAKVEHPRGVTYRDGQLWVMHPPTLSVFQDTDGDGVADVDQVLVTGLTTNQITDRGGDHTTNCVRMGIDGWLYVGVGDYGIQQARARDGSIVVMRGGGIVRVRPDGTELEVYCQGLRNPFDLAIDPFMNIFTRDNTNDGAGWDTRVSLLKQSALYGYTQVFANFTAETMPALGTFGNSGGTGGLFIQDPSWPEGFNNTLFTGDWGRSEVYRHELTPHGATFDLRQDVFLQIPRATGMDIDALGRLYVASWYGGEASVFVGPNVGFVTRITPAGSFSPPFADLKRATLDELLQLLSSPKSVARLHAQGEILARGASEPVTRRLVALAGDEGSLLEGRVAAVFTLKQLNGPDSHAELVELAKVPVLREFALRALTDRAGELASLPPELFASALTDTSPRVRAQALISLGRLGQTAVASHIIPWTTREADSTMPTRQPVQNQPDPGRVVPHLAVRALVALQAVDACLEALDQPHASGALEALRNLHTREAVEGLIKRLRTAHDPTLRRGILVTLMRLHSREADYDGSWWGIRPDTTGPYYDPVAWELTPRIREVLITATQDADPETLEYLQWELQRHQVQLPGVELASRPDAGKTIQPIVLPQVDPSNPNQIGNLAFEAVSTRALAATGEPARGATLFKSQQCVACHTTADGQTPQGPHLFEIGKRYKPPELVESILKPSEKLAQGYETYSFVLTDGRILQGFVVTERAGSTLIREANGTPREIKKTDVEEKRIQQQSAMPEGLVANLTPEQLADLLAYLQSLH